MERETTFATELNDLQDRIYATPAQALADRIREARKAFGSHDALAKAVGGTSRQHLIKLEQAKHRPRAEMLVAIATATGRPTDFFLAEVEHPRPFVRRESTT